MTVGSTPLHIYYDAQGRPAILNYNGTVYIYITNMQGDILGLRNTSGTEVVRYNYDPWGYLLGTTGSLATTVGKNQPLRYRGYVYDEETGLYYLQSRYYHPEWGRFISSDSVINGNLFAYCGNNPVMQIDSNGNEAVTVSPAINGSSLVLSAVVLLSGVINWSAMIVLTGIGVLFPSHTASDEEDLVKYDSSLAQKSR